MFFWVMSIFSLIVIVMNYDIERYLRALVQSHEFGESVAHFVMAGLYGVVALYMSLLLWISRSERDRTTTMFGAVLFVSGMLFSKELWLGIS
jgi:uncharacterized membrane protein YhaH (DUF805 family)